MNIHHFIDHPTTLQLGLTLLHSVWQLTLLAAALWVSLRLMRGRSAQTRYALGCVALLGMLACPVVTFLMLNPHTATQTSVTEKSSRLIMSVDENTEAEPGLQSQIQTHAPVIDVSALFNTQESVAIRESEAQANRETFEWASVIPYITATWLLGVACLSIQLMTSFISVRKLSTRGVKDLPKPIAHAARSLARQMGLKRAVSFLESTAVLTPTVVGHLAPVVLLPASAVTGLSPNQMRAILAHELAHIQRHDYLINLAQCLIETLLFFHPGVWYVSACIRLEREMCCDDAALAICDEPNLYAKALLQLAEAATGIDSQLAPTATGSDLLVRVRRILSFKQGLPNQPAKTASTLPNAILATLLFATTLTLAISCAGTVQSPLSDGDKLTKARKQIIARHQKLRGNLDITYHETIHYTPNLEIALAKRLLKEGEKIPSGSVARQNRFSMLNDLVRTELNLTSSEEARQREGLASQKNLEDQSSILTVYRPEHNETLSLSMRDKSYDSRIIGRDTDDATRGNLIPSPVDWPQVLIDQVNSRYIPKPETEINRAVRKKLATKMDVDFDNEKFTTVIQKIQNTINVNIFVNWNVLETAGIRHETTVRLSLDSAPASEVLDLTLAQLSNDRITIAYEARDGILVIDTFESITESIEEDYVQDGLITESEADRAVRKKLDVTFAISYDNDPFSAVVEQQSNFTGIKFNVDWPTLKKAGIEQSSTVTLNLDQVSASTALQLILAQLGGDTNTLDYAIIDGEVLISTAQALNANTNVLTYNLRDLHIRYNTFIDVGLGLRRLNNDRWLGANGWDAIDLEMHDDGKVIGRLELADNHVEQWTWDPGLEYALVLVERFRDGKLYHQITPKQFEKVDGLMLPMHIGHKAWSTKTGHSPFNGKIKIDIYQIGNPTNNESLYQIHLPEGAKVSDLSKPKLKPVDLTPIKLSNPPKSQPDRKVTSQTENNPKQPPALTKLVFQKTRGVPITPNQPNSRPSPLQFNPPLIGIMSTANIKADRLPPLAVALISRADNTLIFYNAKLKRAESSHWEINVQKLLTELAALESKPKHVLSYNEEAIIYLFETNKGDRGVARFRRPKVITNNNRKIDLVVFEYKLLGPKSTE